VAFGLVALVGWNLLHLPPAVNADGGYPAAERAAGNVDAALTTAGIGRDKVILVRSLPAFKSTEAMVYPLAVLGRAYIGEVPKSVAPGSVPGSAGSSEAAEAAEALILLCDDLFRDANHAPCGGPAEALVTADAGGAPWGPLLERFEAAPGRWVSVYGPGPG
jgi:hypothetical protein